MLVLCLVAVLAISTCNVAGQSCSYTFIPDPIIDFPSIELPVTGLENCKTYCTSSADCQGFYFDPSNGMCRMPTLQTGVLYDHLDIYVKSCQASRDVVSDPGNPQCFKTNYQGSVSDLWTAPNGVTWNFQIAHFGFDWPQSGDAFQPPSKFVFIEEISFKSSDNLVYFRVVFTLNNGKTITTQAIGPNDRSTTLSGANDVKRVDFYLAPDDFRRNVSLTDVYLRACFRPGNSGNCILFNHLKDRLPKASLGIMKLGGTSGTFSASVAPEYPYVELDLKCAGLGTVSFSDVIFDGAQNFKFVVVNIWDGDTAVPIPEGDTFSNPQDIKLTSGVSGNRIRSKIIPIEDPNQGISFFIKFSKYSVLANF